ncbi:probable CAMK-1 Ca2+/calmodulin-dependent kinase-1 [Ramularia collo-cygni]|uniref:calcium/calmodulin-dependent protein kinase n=1 Tax=Ramularia collo-cygni TaxID=112498 RepID=A0A2D3UT20_9PEZI|nr:probable CAMK-1 Ca2+/calmodulin-dependent kinase-1 [Ramularia collo-cygni]CZT19501.1 probable CAMK-1 Ca2+/calmodulin-dependent kinase-1 [Ramularia collo-cygni]
MSGLQGMLNKLHGQPDSYDRKSKYRMGRTLGAGTYGIVKEADGPTGKVAVKIILKKNVKGNDQMVYDELEMLQTLQHPHIVKFVDWFESRDKYYIITQLATGGELFDRICEMGKFTEKNASQTMRQVLEAVDYLHTKDVVHRDLKPENLLYLTREPNSDLVLADFGIAKHLDSPEGVLKTMAGSFGYAAPEVMLKRGHSKPVDMWSLGVITYTLLCGYSPFRSESLTDLIDETRNGRVVFHERYWKDVSKEAKSFILSLLKPDPHARATSAQALQDPWIAGKGATDHNLLPEIKAYIARARLKRGVELVKLANRIESLKMQEDEEDGVPQESDIPADPIAAADDATSHSRQGSVSSGVQVAEDHDPSKKRSLSKLAKSAIFREVVLAKVREIKAEEEAQKTISEATGKSSK